MPSERNKHALSLCLFALSVNHVSYFYGTSCLVSGPHVIAFLQAILGGTIQVPTLTGDVVLKVSIVINLWFIIA